MKRDAAPNYFENIVNDLGDLKKIPFIGVLIGPYIDPAQQLISSVNQASDNSLSNIVNSILPCTFNGPRPTCKGTLDMDSVKILIKKVLDILPISTFIPKAVPIADLLKDML